ncbi:protein jim lovell isoform X1 [Frankliniella occidentalis]|uniref:Protein jim lovell isoform X1 n=1 Tax=Frankliniella occidentalis TaxID=133901 RepID=A0A6J1S9E5_FRAOC|nr:protein jim lovell isoform X1 [Frankliniella occidentalis]
MGSSTQLYNLGWNDFDSSLRLAVKGLRSRRDLVDVTLAAGGKTFPAHKLILSAASSLFLELLKITPCQHPVILLAGIGARELEQVLDFVYTGEVAVRPSELTALLQAAHVLEIRGLVQGSITAEKPEDQEKAEAALAASTEEGEKVSAASLAAATKSGLLDTVSMGSEPPRSKQKKKRRYSDCCDAPHDKWGKYDSDDDTSDSEGPLKEVQTNTIATQTISTESSVSQTIQEVVKSNNSGLADSGQKPQKQSVGTLTSVSMCPTPVPITSGKQDQSIGVTGNQPPASLEAARHMPLCMDESTMIPPHHLEMNEDEEINKEDSYADIAAAADAAALAASTLADKKGVSEQPAACPLCNAIIRQSRNLRRHLELKHFGKRPKKGKGGKRKTRSSQCDTDTESNAGSVADTTVIEHVQVEMKSPCEAVLSSVPASASSSPTQTPPPKHHTLTELQPAHQHHNVEAYLHQQQLQQLDSFHHMAPPTSNSTYQIPYPHPHPHLSMLRGDPHVSILQEFRNSQFSTSYSGSTRSSNHQ